MAKPPTKGIAAIGHDLRGFKQLRKVAQMLTHLHDVGGARDQAGNRKLHYDDYVLLMLLALFDPLIDSMRTLQLVSDLDEVRARLGIKRRFSLGSFSESCRVFAPEMLDGSSPGSGSGCRPRSARRCLRTCPAASRAVTASSSAPCAP